MLYGIALQNITVLYNENTPVLLNIVYFSKFIKKNYLCLMIVKVKGYMIKKINISAFCGLSKALCGVTICPPLLKTLSELVLVAGVHKYFLESFANKG